MATNPKPDWIARAERDRYREALRAIAEADPVDLVLDPTWAQRIAAGALGGEASDAF